MMLATRAMTTMISRPMLILLLCSGLLLSTPQLMAASVASGPHIQVSLLSEHRSLQPEQSNWIGIRFQPESSWHTYWRNPGDSGEPPRVTWRTPDGVAVGDWRWPLPQQIPVAHLLNYGYQSDLLLMAPVTLASSWLQQTLTLQADLSWLVCKEDCIPGWASLELTLPVDAEPLPSRHQPLFVTTRAQLPANQLLQASHQLEDERLRIVYQPPYAADWRLLPLRADTLTHSQPQQTVVDGSYHTSQLQISDYFVDSGQQLQFLLSDGQRGFYLNSEPGALPVAEQPTLLLLMLMAFAGGLILNLMPCVLPVLSLKALSLQQQTGSTASKFGYLLGVLLSFNLFALLIILLQQGGEVVGWGFHMQQPWVVALLAFLFLFIALQLMDIAPSGSRLMGLGQQLTQGDSFSSQLFTGVLAVLVAAPCTAPFMATALGVALVSPPLVGLALFSSLGLGFALPMSLLFWFPHSRNLLPKPGPWMQPFRQFLAFPMLATIIWLLWIYQQQTDHNRLFGLLVALLGFSLSVWLAGVLRGAANKLALLAALAAVLLPIAASKPQPEPALSQTEFSEQRLQQLRDADQVVLVNMTADWCITCKVNEQVAFSSGRLQQLLDEDGVHYLVGDWTNQNQAILAYLNRYQRSGVPLYVVYAGHHHQQVLPQLLTPQIVIDAINRAKQELNHEA